MTRKHSRRKVLTKRLCLVFSEHIACALDVMKERGLGHCDVKPSNGLIEKCSPHGSQYETTEHC
jgi:serine/threonine protein kinase